MVDQLHERKTKLSVFILRVYFKLIQTYLKQILQT